MRRSMGAAGAMNWRRAAFSLAVIGAFSFGVPASAADPVELKRGGTLQFYGQFTPSYLVFDDGLVQSKRTVDNSNSNSRIGVWYVRPYSWGKLSANLEIAFGVRQSATATQNSTSSLFDDSRRSLRKAEVIWQSERWGTFYAGQGSMASDGVALQDLSGTSIVSSVGIADTAGSFFLRTTSGSLSVISIVSVFPSFDGGRGPRFRYDTPSFRGFVLSTSVGNKVETESVETDDSDVSVRFSRDWPLFKVVAAGAYTWKNSQNRRSNQTVIGSVSVLHKPTGISFSTSSGKRDTTGSYQFFKLGYEANFMRVGPSSISLDYYGASNMISDGSKSESVGFGVIQKFSNPRLEGYFSLRSYEYADLTPVDYENAYSFLIGARWKF